MFIIFSYCYKKSTWIWNWRKRSLYSLLMNHSVANCAYGVFYSLSLLWHYRMLIHAWNGTCCTVLDKLLFSCFTPPTFFFPQMNIHLSCFTNFLFYNKIGLDLSLVLQAIYHYNEVRFSLLVMCHHRNKSNKLKALNQSFT